MAYAAGAQLLRFGWERQVGVDLALGEKLERAGSFGAGDPADVLGRI